MNPTRQTVSKYILQSEYFHGALKDIKLSYTSKDGINYAKLKLRLAYNIDDSCQFNNIGDAMKLLGDYITQVSKNGIDYDLECLYSFQVMKI